MESKGLLISARGMTMFGDIDFQRDASKTGLQLFPARLFIFGNPAAGTPLIQAAPTSPLDLPLNVLVTQDPDGVAWLRYNSPS